ncbi:MAG TPA: tetratricopeptide repeat protein [Vicinamibacterales bacterium]
MSRSAAFGLLVAAGVLTFWNSLSTPFVYDDAATVTNNLTIREWRTALSPPPHDTPVSGRPIVNLSLAVNYALGGLEPRGYHVANVVIHVACALLLFEIVRVTLTRRSAEASRSVRGAGAPHATHSAHATLTAAFFAALIWLVHPLDSEPADYVTARTESLMALFLLLTLYCANRAYRDRQPIWDVLAVASCALGMLCKETMAVAPLIVAGYDRVFLFGSVREAWRSRWRLYAGLAMCWAALAWTLWTGPRSGSVGLKADAGLVQVTSASTYLMNQVVMIAHYLKLVVWPSALVLDYGVPRGLSLSEIIVPAVLLALVLVGAIVAGRRRPDLAFLAAVVVITLAPTSSVVPIHTEVGAERRMYLPMMAIAVLAVGLSVALWRKYVGTKHDRAGAITAACLCGVLALLTIQRNAEYSSPLTMWQSVVDRWPHGRARYNLSLALKSVGQDDESLAMLRSAVEDYPDARSILGFRLLDAGKTDEGIAELRAFLRERPSHANAPLAHGRIADALFGRQQYAEAVTEYREYLSRRSDQATAWTNYGIALAATGQNGEAVKAFSKAAAIEPDSASVHRNLANALLDGRDFAGAVREATEAARLAPGDKVVAEILGLARAGQQGEHGGHQPEARPLPSDDVVAASKRPVPLRSGIGSAHDAVSTKSTQAQAFYDQGLAYLHSYWWLEAARSFNQALMLDAKLALAQAGLSIAYTELNAPAAAREALASAQTLAAGATEHDRVHVELRSMQFAAEEAGTWDQAALARYREALDRAVASLPADEELWLLRGLAESQDPAERGQGSPESAVRFYEKALGLNPSHFAAHHYLTHAYENAGRINEALAEGSTYAKMAPGVPHARHMYGHNLRRAGRIGEAIAEFEKADALETGYFKAERIPVSFDWHYQHNVDLLATSYQYVGKMAKAEALLRTSFGIESGSEEQEFNKREYPVFLLARGRNRDALATATMMAAHPSPIVSAAGHVMVGRARLALGEYQAGADEANIALRQMRASPLGAGIVAAALQQLQGEFFLRTGQRDKGRATLQDVVKKVRAAPGPDAWTQALFTLESIARVAREVGDWDLAGWTAAQMLEHDPNYAGTHLAIGLVAQHRGDQTAAHAAFDRARQYWKDADAELPEWQVLRR